MEDCSAGPPGDGITRRLPSSFIRQSALLSDRAICAADQAARVPCRSSTRPTS